MREEQFMVDMIAMTADLPTDLFDGLVHHLSVCGVERRSSKLKELRRYMQFCYHTCLDSIILL